MKRKEYLEWLHNHNKGLKRSEEQRSRISEARKGYKPTKEHIENAKIARIESKKWNEAMKSDDRKRKIAISAKNNPRGFTSPNYWTEERKLEQKEEESIIGQKKKD